MYNILSSTVHCLAAHPLCPRQEPGLCRKIPSHPYPLKTTSTHKCDQTIHFILPTNNMFWVNISVLFWCVVAGVRPRLCPEEHAGWLSMLFYNYANGLIRTGLQKHLEHDDLWDVSRWDDAGAVSSVFFAHMKGTATEKSPQVSSLPGYSLCHVAFARLFLATTWTPFSR